MRIIDEVKLDFKDVLFVPKRSTLKSRREVDLERTYRFKHSGVEWKGLPVMAANMDGVGTFDMAKSLFAHKMFTCLVKSYSLDDFIAESSEVDVYYGNHAAVSTGTSDNDWIKLQQILNTYPEFRFICIDVANGYSEHFGDFVAKVRARYPEHVIIAGNVVTADMTQELILRGADIVKVGIGPGSVCTTRLQTGVGYPQLSAIIECADAAHGLDAHIIADGGCTCPGDVAKAFGAGADFVMLGGMLAGHTEGGGTVENGKVTFYGMSSDTAMGKHHGGVAEYRSSEGKTVTIPYRGDVKNTVQDILGGVRSTCTYVGAPTLKQLSKCTTFVRVTQQVNNIFGAPSRV
jgi:GMP reductase